jgi:phosphoglycerol transferase MdoB-like AlkP superfamily enzyme
MAQKRRTFVTALKSHGYRAVAVMPGLQEYWPEGAFYEFDRIYDTQQLAYTGPSFGWWPIPDQFALAQLEHLELARRDRAPVFAFLPTTSTHTPFSPTPPYQPSWPRMLTSTPYDEADYQKAWAQPPDWSYVHSMDYALATLGGFVSQPRTRDLVMILIGDHQPPAVVSGEGAPWDVPVHVVSSRPALLDALKARGFTAGLQPGSRTPLMRLHELMPALVAAMDGSRATTAAARSGS